MNKKTKPVAVMCFSSGTGGMERSAIRLAETLAKISDVTLVCKKGSFVQKLYEQGKYPFACEAVSFFSRTFSPSILFGVRRIIDAHEIVNVIFFGASELKTLYFSFLGKDLNVTVWHGTTKSRPKSDLFHRLVYSCVDYHVTISEHLKQNVKKIIPMTEKVTCRVIRPSFSFDETPNIAVNSNPEHIKIVHVGRVAHGKGQIDAVLACRGLYETGVKFELSLVGGSEDEEYMDELIELVDSLPYKSSIKIEGYVEDVNSYLKKSDVFLFPSSGEGMPGSYIEALFHGLVCLSYHNTVFPEFLEMGFHVFMVKDGHVEKLSHKLFEIALNINNEKISSKENIDLAKHLFSKDREISDWYQVLR